MKRYEKMSKEDIIDLITSVVKYDSDRYGKHPYHCAQAILNCLNEEIELVPRIATINTAERFEKVREDFHKFCNFHCDECRIYKKDSQLKSCFDRYLAEEVGKE